MAFPTIDHSKKVTRVRGRGDVRYMQNGYGFDLSYKYLGKVKDSGELIEDKVKPKAEMHQVKGT